MACNDSLSPVSSSQSLSPYGPIGSPLVNPVQEDSSETTHPKRLKVGGKTVRFPENPESSCAADDFCQSKRAYKSVLKKVPPSPVLEGSITELSYAEKKAAEIERLTALFTKQFQKLLENPNNEECLKDCTVTLINSKHQFDTALHLVDLQDKSKPKNREALDKILLFYLSTQASATIRNKLPDILKQVEIRLSHSNTAEIVEYLVFTKKQTKIDSLALMELAGKTVPKYPEIKEKLIAAYREAFNDEVTRLKDLVTNMVKQPENEALLAKAVACLIRIYLKGLSPDPTDRLNILFKELKLNARQVVYFKRLLLSQFFSSPEGFRYLTQELTFLLRNEIIHKASQITPSVAQLVEKELENALTTYDAYGVDTLSLLCTAWKEAERLCDKHTDGISIGEMIVQTVYAKRLLPLILVQPTHSQYLSSMASCLLKLERHGINPIFALEQLLIPVLDDAFRDQLKKAILLKIALFLQVSEQLKELFIVELIDNAEKNRMNKPLRELLDYFTTYLQTFEKMDVKLVHLLDHAWNEAKEEKQLIHVEGLFGEYIVRDLKAALIFWAKKGDA